MFLIILVDTLKLCLSDLINFIAIDKDIEDLGACLSNLLPKRLEKIWLLAFFFSKPLNFAAAKPSIKRVLGAKQLLKS